MTDEKKFHLRIENLKAALERKAGLPGNSGGKPRVRRVRTARGAEIYGQPIGSIIVMDGRTGGTTRPSKKPSALTPPKPSAAKVPAPSASASSSPETDTFDANGKKIGVGTSVLFEKDQGSGVVSKGTIVEVLPGGVFVKFTDDATGELILRRAALLESNSGTKPKKAPAKKGSVKFNDKGEVLSKDEAPLYRGASVRIDGKPGIWQVATVSPTGSAITLKRFDKVTGKMESARSGPNKLTSADFERETLEPGQVFTGDRNIAMKDSFVFKQSGSRFDVFSVHEVHPDTDEVSIFGTQQVGPDAVLERVPASSLGVIFENYDRTRTPEYTNGEKPKVGDQVKFSLDDFDDADYVTFTVTDRDKFTLRLTLEGTDASGNKITRRNVNPGRLQQYFDPAKSKNGSGSPMKIGQNYKIRIGFSEVSTEPRQFLGFDKYGKAMMAFLRDDGTADIDGMERFDIEEIMDLDATGGLEWTPAQPGSFEIPEDRRALALADAKQYADVDFMFNDAVNFEKKLASSGFAMSMDGDNGERFEIKRIDNGTYRVTARYTSAYTAQDRATYDNYTADSPKNAMILAAHIGMSFRRRMTEIDESGEPDTFGRVAANRKARDFPSLHDYDDGIRGLDWKWSDDEEVDYKDESSRRRMAMKELKDMGVRIGKNENSLATDVDTDGSEFDVYALENVARTLRAHENMYPGMVPALFHTITLDPKTDAIAYNRSWSNTSGHNAGKQQQRELGFSGRFFGANSDISSEWIMPEGHTAAKPYGFKVNDPDKEMAAYNYETLVESGIVSTTTHEIGHSVGHILYNALGKDGAYTSGTEMETDDENASVANQFRSELLGLLDYYGILGDDFDGDYEDYLTKYGIEDSPDAKAKFNRRVFEQLQETDVVRKKTLDDWNKIYPVGRINHAALAEHLSTYGATNFQELMAETWSAYHLHTEPGDFVRDIGRVMQAAAQEFLADIGKPRVKNERDKEIEGEITKIRDFKPSGYEFPTFDRDTMTQELVDFQKKNPSGTSLHDFYYYLSDKYLSGVDDDVVKAWRTGFYHSAMLNYGEEKITTDDGWLRMKLGSQDEVQGKSPEVAAAFYNGMLGGVHAHGRGL